MSQTASPVTAATAGRLRQPFAPRAFTAVFARVLVAFTFVLICAGALVTANKASLADTHWPKFVGTEVDAEGNTVGQWVPSKELWIGGLRYEDTHRVIAGATGILALLLAVWLQATEKRAWVRRLGWAAFGLVVAQALFGGLIIHSQRTPLVSMVHGSLAQAFFLIALALAAVTSRGWASPPAQVERDGNNSMVATAKVAVGVAFFQLVMGAGVRHSDLPGAAFVPHLVAHIIGALAVIAVAAWCSIRITTEYADVAPLKRTVFTIDALLGIQLLLGIWAIWANRGRLAPQLPRFDLTVVSTLHVVNGALILALTLYLALRAAQMLPRRPAGRLAATLAESAA
jgi:cytochrome c oxidase assembly protein subunit 15